VLREYIVSEAFAALGIPSTRALAAVTTGEAVARETMQPGGVLTRVAASHIRVGTFQYFAARQDTDALRHLADHVIARHYPDAARAPNPYRALIDAVIVRQAALVARWMSVGFIHGVMNTDNMSIAGETIDFGPCAFMDFYDPAQVYSSIDQRGRYAYGNQPPIAGWNLARLAETLIPLLADTKDAAVAEGQSAIDAYKDLFERSYHAALGRKLGLVEVREGDAALSAELLDRMAANGADFTATFRLLNALAVTGTETPERTELAEITIRNLFVQPEAFDAWRSRWQARMTSARLTSHRVTDADRRAVMRVANPIYIPRNHLIEEAIVAAVNSGDFAPFEKLNAVLANPFDERPGLDRYTLPPQPGEIVHQTFCGT
jgi:serine/tyrosine/threonine adenylyltransferase